VAADPGAASGQDRTDFDTYVREDRVPRAEVVGQEAGDSGDLAPLELGRQQDGEALLVGVELGLKDGVAARHGCYS